MLSLRVTDESLYIENQFSLCQDSSGEGRREEERDVHVDNKVKRSYHILHRFDSP